MTMIISAFRRASMSFMRFSMSSIPLLRPFGCASDGEGGPASAQSKRRAPGRALPPGWWLAPAAALGALLWVLIGMALWQAGHWLAGVL